MNEPVQVAVSVRRSGSTASEGRVRNHVVTMDRPTAKGGEDRGAMGGEHLLMSLGGCFMSNLLAAATAREVPLDDVHLAITGTLEGPPSRFTRVDMAVTGSGCDREALTRLVTIAERGCIVANTVKNAVALTISVTAG